MTEEIDNPEFRLERKRVVIALNYATAEAEKRYLKAKQDFQEAKTLNDMPPIEIKNKYPEIWGGLLKLEESITKKTKEQDNA